MTPPNLPATFPHGPVEGMERCSRCDRPWTLTPTRLFTWDFGGGPERVCIECKEAARTEMPLCECCDMPRMDVDDRFHLCTPCRAANNVKRWFAELTEMHDQVR